MESSGINATAAAAPPREAAAPANRRVDGMLRRGPAKGIIDYVIFFIVWFGTTFLVYSIYGYIFI